MPNDTFNEYAYIAMKWDMDCFVLIIFKREAEGLFYWTTDETWELIIPGTRPLTEKIPTMTGFQISIEVAKTSKQLIPILKDWSDVVVKKAYPHWKFNTDIKKLESLWDLQEYLYPVLKNKEPML